MTVVLFLSFFILLSISVPIAISLGIASIISLSIFTEIPLLIIAQKAFNGVNSFSFMAIPFFLLAGNIMAESEISDRLVSLASLIVGRFTGGLAHVSTGASAFFGAISGSSPATTAAIGSVMIPQMEKKGYDKAYSGAVVAASGALGLIIPPSITMVVYGVMAGVSIGDLFISGIVPGILISLALMIVNYIIAKKQGIEKEKAVSAKEKSKIIKDSILPLLMPGIILGGIYSGVFTATESAAVACLYGIILGFFVYKKINLKVFSKIARNTAESAALVMFLMATAKAFGYILTYEQIPQQFTAMLLGITNNVTLILFMLLGMLLIIGTFLDNIAALVLIVPTLMNLVKTLGIDPIYFGVFMVISLAIGQFTPPVGLNLFIASDVAKIKFEEISKYVLPYILAYVIMVSLFIFFPFIITVFV